MGVIGMPPKPRKFLLVKVLPVQKLTLNILNKIQLSPMEDQGNSEDKTPSEGFHLALNN